MAAQAELTRSLEAVGAGDASHAGGKGASLGELIRAGFPVPAGFVILAAAFERFMAVSGVRDEAARLLAHPDGDDAAALKRSADEIRGRMLDADMPHDIARAIEDAFGELGSAHVAVRSSASSEDGAADAWAGQLDTYLDMTAATLLRDVQRCWASLFSPRAILYRIERGQAEMPVSVAVVVQAMIESESAGTAFSAHPVTGDRTRIVIEAGYGLGEAIVSGQVTPDSYEVAKQPLAIAGAKRGAQDRGLYRAPEGGTVWRDLSPEQRARPALTEAQVLELAQIVIRIENHYGFPCDIEWALAGSSFFVLQSRPITALDPDRAGWIDLGHRETSLLEASVKLEAWSHGLEEIAGRGYRHYTIDSDGAYRTTDEDERAVTQALSARDGTDFEERTSALGMQIIEGIAASAPLEPLLDTLVLQFARFLADRHRADLLYADPEIPRGVKERIIAWRNDAELFRSYDVLLAAIATKLEMSNEEVELLALAEVRQLLEGTALDAARLVSMRRDGWTCALENGGVFVSAPQRRVAGSPIPDEEVRGTVAYGTGIVTGTVGKEILVVPMTRPEDVPRMRAFKAVVTDAGGILSHAAITCRELGIPCIVGTGEATRAFAEGDVVELDLRSGVVRLKR